ncbi:MAG: DUF4982 domain-containing protein [Clostridia bacterium]|nr:DUF4982 domain-containing protein [Clostridia bacterium]
MKIQKLLKNWQITLNGETTPVQIPHDFMVGQPRRADSTGTADMGYFVPGRAEYRTTFHAEPDAACHFLRFDGVMGLSEVYVNGNLVRTHAYGYAPFTCDVSAFIKEGENALFVIADTTSQSTSRWYTGGGIFREVELYTAGASYICPYSLWVQTKALVGTDAFVQFSWRVFSDKPQTAELTLEIPALERKIQRSVWLKAGENADTVQTMLHDVALWSPEEPHLYACTLTLQTTDGTMDSAGTTFGVRTIHCDSRRGLLLNGEPIKPYGTCVHHDNGIIGAASYRSAEERRVRILKENGFNCIRCAHNPPSDWMLDACDRLGMLVIDELFDAWRLPKRNFDYHIWFDTCWKEDTDSIICRDRRHPSVILWSTGNEIYEKNGVSDGYHTARDIAERIRILDDSRPVTHAFCSFWDNPEYSQKEYETRDVRPPEWDFFADRIRYSAGTLDVLGYNYLLHRMPDDELRFPDRLFALTESYPMDVVEIKRYMDKHPRMIGDFVWTGWDYFGETGIGHVAYGEEPVPAWALTPFPNHIADCGDIDICGWRKPQSWYRDAAWKNSVCLLTADPARYGQKYGITAWGFYDVHRSWTYTAEPGSMTTVFVCTIADTCELFQDGVSCGRKAPDTKGIAKFEIPYRPGELTAVAYTSGTETARDTLRTTGTPTALQITPCDRNDLIYAEIALTDADGNIAWGSAEEITVSVEGAALLAVGSGENAIEHIYTDPVCHAYRGRILAVVLPNADGTPVTIRAAAGELQAELTISG